LKADMESIGVPTVGKKAVHKRLQSVLPAEQQEISECKADPHRSAAGLWLCWHESS
jgi:hypothetical protein